MVRQVEESHPKDSFAQLCKCLLFGGCILQLSEVDDGDRGECVCHISTIEASEMELCCDVEAGMYARHRGEMHIISHDRLMRELCLYRADGILFYSQEKR